jgi:biopolymer transport protein ExbD
MSRHARETELITRVNVTPIIDVALVLVIILLVTAPMLSIAEMQVDLPAARSRGAEEERNLSITLGTRGELAVDRDTVTASTLQSVLRERLSQPGNESVLVVVRADTGAPYVRVGQILEDARAAGARRIAIATRQAVTADEVEALRRGAPRASSTAEENR